MSKTAKISKEIFNYLRNNENEAKQVLKSLEKRRKKDLPVEIDGSSQISQSALVEVDLTGMKRAVLDGVIAVRDMPIISRKRKSLTTQNEQEQLEEDDSQEPEEQQFDEPEQLQQFDEHEQLQELQDEESQEPEEQQLNEEEQVEVGSRVLSEDLVVGLPENLLLIVNDLYYSLKSPIFNPTLTQIPPVELNEFSFVPLTSNASETLHLSSFTNNGLLAEKTRNNADSSYSLRCFNTYLAMQAWVKKVMDLEPAKTETQVIYSLKDRISQGNNVDIEWNHLKRCSRRGKALYEFMDQLNFGTFCITLYY